MLERALPKAARVVAVSRELGARAAELGVSEERIDIVENGVDRTLFYPQDRAQAREQLGFGNGRLILYVGRLEREKGVLDLVRAVNDLRLRSPNAPVRLALVGEGSARDECQGLVQELGAPVQFAGARPLEEIPIWMAAADVVTLPSHNEGCPNVVLEALASGRRVVATSVGAIPDIVRSSALGELVAPRDVYALTRTLDRAVKTEYDPETVALGSGTIDWPQSALQLYRSIQHAVGGPELGGSPRLRVAA
jgi:glycosyltransferase involved in cell wall biosynthesis